MFSGSLHRAVAVEDTVFGMLGFRLPLVLSFTPQDATHVKM